MTSVSEFRNPNARTRDTTRNWVNINFLMRWRDLREKQYVSGTEIMYEVSARRTSMINPKRGMGSYFLSRQLSENRNYPYKDNITPTSLRIYCLSVFPVYPTSGFIQPMFKNLVISAEIIIHNQSISTTGFLSWLARSCGYLLHNKNI